jgi:hypothetical protein
MTYQKNGFTFRHIRASQWEVTFDGIHFAYVSTKAVIRAMSA